MTTSEGPGNDLVVLGKVAKAHGIKGEIKIFPYSGQPENFLHYETIFITADHRAKGIKYFIEKSRIQGKFVRVSLQGCQTRNDAENLIGSEVTVLRSELPDLNPDEFYLADLEGKRVVTTEGEVLGLVTGILQTGGHDIISIDNDGREYLVPLTREFLVRFDANEVLVNLPPGLLDINKP